MIVLIVEDNLFWSARLRQSVTALGATPVVSRSAELTTDPPATVAIVNLGGRTFSATDVIRSLRAQGVRVIGHAGHKETDLLAAGRDAGCDQIVSNGSLTFHLPQILGLAPLTATTEELLDEGADGKP